MVTHVVRGEGRAQKFPYPQNEGSLNKERALQNNTKSLSLLRWTSATFRGMLIATGGEVMESVIAKLWEYELDGWQVSVAEQDMLHRPAKQYDALAETLNEEQKKALWQKRLTKRKKQCYNKETI